MQLDTPAIVCSLRSHGEHGAVVRLMTAGDGLLAAYVRGARGRRMRPVLMAGNLVEARLRARTDAQLPQAEVELVHSRGPLYGEPLPAAAIEWATALTASALPEGQPYPRIHQALDALLSAIEAAPAASGWGAALVRFELLVLAELGFGLDLEAADSPVAVDARSGRALGAAEAALQHGRLLPLPAFVRAGGRAGWGEISQGLTLSGHFLERDVLSGGRSHALADARARLAERLRRAGGLT